MSVSTPNRDSDARHAELRLVGVEPTTNATTVRRPLAEYLAETHEACGEDECEADDPMEVATIPSSREPGVDLAILHPDDIDAGKLASFLSVAAEEIKGCESMPRLRKAVSMPMAKTDLEEIFETDQICMVALPRAKTFPSAQNTEAVHAEALPQPLPLPVAAVAPDGRTPRYLDKTEQYLVENWPKLPPNVQAAILNVIDVAIGPDDE